MIRVTAEPERLTVQGHAGFAPRGQDIVCAAVSALMLALSIRLYYRYNTLNLDEIIALSGKEEV